MTRLYRHLLALVLPLGLAALVGCSGSGTDQLAEVAATALPNVTLEAATNQLSTDLAPESAAATAVTGTVTYLERMALAPDAVITVQLQDVSAADAAATVLAEQRIVAEGRQVPIAFELPIDPAAIQPANAYSVSARIEDGGGKLLFISDTIVPVLTAGAPSANVEVMVVPIGSVGGNALTGVVNLADNGIVPEDATLTVQIQDVTLQDVAATIVAEQVIPLQGRQAPIDFALDYDAANIVDGNVYSLAARITDAGGAPIYLTDTIIPVLTGGNPADNVPLVLVPVGSGG